MHVCLCICCMWWGLRIFLECLLTFTHTGLQRDVVYLGGPIAPSYMSPIAVEGGSCGSQTMSKAVHILQKN
jgi:hypothetical protein